MIAVRPTINCTLLFVTGEDDTARFDFWRYTYNVQNHYHSLLMEAFVAPEDNNIRHTFSHWLLESTLLEQPLEDHGNIPVKLWE